MAWGVRRYLIARGDYTQLKKTTLTIGASAFFLTEMARSFYRPYVYENDIYDWVVADTIGNSLGTVTAVFMILTMSGRGTNRDWRIVGLVITGLIGYELVNFIGNHPFDINDVVATIVFGSLSIVVYAKILSLYGETNAPSE